MLFAVKTRKERKNNFSVCRIKKPGYITSGDLLEVQSKTQYENLSKHLTSFETVPFSEQFPRRSV